MESLLSLSSGRLLRACQRSSSTFFSTRPACRGYMKPPACQRCKKISKGINAHGSIPARWISKTAGVSSSDSHATSTNEGTSSTQNPSAPPNTHYEFFPKSIPSGPPPLGSFVVDLRQLRNEYLQLQAVAHPDRHPPGLKSRAEATSSRINEAYKTLQHPLLRAQYLLSLRGIDVAGDESAKVEDPELLMEVLDTRELIESATEEEELEELRGVNEERILGSEAILERAFGEDDLPTAKEEAVRLRYWINIRESLDAWEKGKPVVLNH